MEGIGTLLCGIKGGREGGRDRRKDGGKEGLVECCVHKERREGGREGLFTFLGMKDHLSPEGKPAPPRPRRPDFFISSTIQSGPGGRREGGRAGGRAGGK